MKRIFDFISNEIFVHARANLFRTIAGMELNMKKVFLNIVLILLIVFVASAFLSGFYVPENESVGKAANAMRSSMKIILIACTMSWVLGTAAGILLGIAKRTFRKTVLYFVGIVLKIPAFLLSAAIILLFGNDIGIVLTAAMLPVFFMTVDVAARNTAYVRTSAFADFMPQLGRARFFKNYVMPMLAAPVAAGFLNGFRVLLYIDLSLGILGIMPSYTLGGIIAQMVYGKSGFPSMLALAISVFLIILINTACLLANAMLIPQNKNKSGFTYKN